MSGTLNRFNLGLFNSGTYIPTIANVISITQSLPAIITVDTDTTFVIGQQVQFFIPPQWGMRQLNLLKGYVIEISDTDEFKVSIDTSQFDAFVIPTPPQFVVIDPAQVAGIGDINTGTSSPGGIPVNPNTIPGAYQNQPP